MYDCITIGDIKLDTFVVLHEANLQCQLKMPECLLCLAYGEKIPVEAIDSQIAGSAANVAVGLSRLNHKTAIVSVMGKDATYKLAMDQMKQEHVNASYIVAMPNAESSFSVVLNYKGEKTILASHKPYVYKLPKLAKSDWFFIGELGVGYVSLFKTLNSFLPVNHTSLAMNPGAIQIQERKKVLYDLMKKAAILVFNLGEAKALTRLTGSVKVPQIVAAAWKLNRKTVVVTDGKNGAYGFDGKTIWYAPLFPGKRVESTGAGDSFATGVLGATMNGLNLPEALKWGAVNAASVVSKVGPQAGLLKENEIRHRLSHNKDFEVRVF